MPHLFGTILRLLMPISWNTSSRCLQLCFTHFSPHIPYNYALALELLKFHTLQVWRLHFDAHFFIRVFSGSRFCPSLIYKISLRVPSCRIRNFTQFSIACNSCPSTRLATAYLVYSNTDIFRMPIRSLKQILP
jgi:hypothetical protein